MSRAWACVFALLCTAFGMAPSTDRSFINITEWWWHQGLSSTSCGWRRTSGHNLWTCIASQTIWPERFQQPRSSVPRTRHIQMTGSPKNATFKAESILFRGEWNPCLSDTVRTEVKGNERLSWKASALFVNNESWDNSSVSKVPCPFRKTKS